MCQYHTKVEPIADFLITVKPNLMNVPIKQALWQAPAMIALACMLGLAINYLRTDRLPLVGNYSADARFTDVKGKSLIVSFLEARRLFEEGSALFLDARPKTLYAQGHIRGAFNLPWETVNDDFLSVADRLQNANTIITYCDGESCDLSHELALFLIEMGLKNVHVLVNGWSVWQEAGLPVEGDGP